MGVVGAVAQRDIAVMHASPPLIVVTLDVFIVALVAWVALRMTDEPGSE